MVKTWTIGTLLFWLAGGLALGNEADAGGRDEATGRFLLSGSLRAVRSRPLVTPRTEDWMNAIRWMAPEGSTVKAGDPVVQFDTSSVQNQLNDKRLAVTQMEAQQEQLTLELEGTRRDKQLEVLKLRVGRDKAKLDTQVPAGLQAARDHQEKQLALERAELELSKAQASLAAFEQEAAARLREQRLRQEKAERDVERSEGILQSLVLKAPVDGVLLHGSHPWEGRKWQVGDTCWPGTIVAEVPDLSSMEIEALLSDVDDGKIAPGLEVLCRLDTFPAEAFKGRIRSISGVAQPIDRNSSRRFFTALIELQKADTTRMRPGMSVQVEVLRGDKPKSPAADSGKVRPLADVDGRRQAVVRGDLAVTVEASGSLSAVRSSAISPPLISQVWDYKIQWMALESTEVKKGQPLVTFDPSALIQELERKQAEWNEAAKSQEKKEVDLQMQLLQMDLQLAEAAGNLQRAKLKVETPDPRASRITLEKLKLDLELATQEHVSLEARRKYRVRSGRSEIESLRQKAQRAQGRVQELESAIQQLTVLAPLDGLVVYRADWRGNKRKTGDNVSTWDRLLELPDLSEMQADAEIDEVDAGRVALGQPVRLRLESHPDVEWRAKVTEIAPIVQRQSQRSALKVYRIKLALETTDTERMRPGMRFRADIEIERSKNVLMVPLEAIVTTQEGAFVDRVDGGSVQRVAVQLGMRNATQVEVRSGLDEGEEVVLP